MHERLSPDIQIVPVEGRKTLDAFIRLPLEIYKHDPAWAPPLLLERRQHLSAKNPFFEHGEWQGWLAYKNQRVVGRISAQLDYSHHRLHDANTGFFGFLEAANDPAVFQALTVTAENWLIDRGMQHVTGPFNFSINDECGLLIEGFDTPPVIMMGHAHPYYSERLQECGYSPVKNLLAYTVNTEKMPAAAKRALRNKHSGSICMRPLQRNNLNEELEILRGIFNDAWANNWGFVPFTQAEFRAMGKSLTMLVDDNFVQIAEVDGKPAAMIICLPNINESIRDMSGRLLPFNWLKLLWRLKVRYPKSGRVPLMGVREEYQRSLLGIQLAFMVIEAVRIPVIARGITQVEMSWILEDNTGMRKIIEAVAGKAYKRYCIYQKALGG